MLIVIYSSRFYPQVGGMETVARQLATCFVELGHEVILITPVLLGEQNDRDSNFSFKVMRKVSLIQRFKLALRADIILHNSISLRALLPDLMFMKKFFVMHQTWYSGKGAKQKFFAYLKLRLCDFIGNVYISEDIKRHIGKKGIVIPNPYDSQLFKRIPEIQKTGDIVFLGRLVTDKGCSLLIRAIAQLKSKNINVNLTVIGEGTERASLKELSQQLILTDQVSFVGVKSGQSLVEILNEHKIMVVPSLWNEPFGIVALEGMACGCFVIGSEGGGLKDAIGSAGLTFKNGNINELIECLLLVLRNDHIIADHHQLIMSHLWNHSEKVIAKRYIDFFLTTIRSHNRS